MSEKLVFTDEQLAYLLGYEPTNNPGIEINDPWWFESDECTIRWVGPSFNTDRIASAAHVTPVLKKLGCVINEAESRTVVFNAGGEHASTPFWDTPVIGHHIHYSAATIAALLWFLEHDSKPLFEVLGENKPKVITILFDRQKMLRRALKDAIKHRDACEKSREDPRLIGGDQD